MQRDHGKATYGSERQQSHITCPYCGFKVELADPGFLERGPIRCGGCGQELPRSVLRRTIQDVLEQGE